MKTNIKNIIITVLVATAALICPCSGYYYRDDFNGTALDNAYWNSSYTYVLGEVCVVHSTLGFKEELWHKGEFIQAAMKMSGEPCSGTWSMPFALDVNNLNYSIPGAEFLYWDRDQDELNPRMYNGSAWSQTFISSFDPTQWHVYGIKPKIYGARFYLKEGREPFDQDNLPEPLFTGTAPITNNLYFLSWINQENAYGNSFLIDWFQVGKITTPTNCQQVWDGGYGNPADLNKDCYVNFADFAILAENWMQCNDLTVLNCNWGGPRSWRDEFFAPSQQRITQAYQALNLQAHDRYRTNITQNAGGIDVSRQTWTMHYDTNGNLQNINILGESFSGVSIAEVALVTASSAYPVVFDNPATVTDEKFFLTITKSKQVSIESQTGLITCTQQLDKMAGHVKIDVNIPSNIRAILTHVKLFNTLGPASSGFTDLYIHVPRFCENPNWPKYYWYAKKVYGAFDVNGTYSNVLWSNGQVGYGIFPLADETNMRVYTKTDGSKAIDMVYDLRLSNKVSEVFFLLPPRKFIPHYEHMSSFNYIPSFGSEQEQSLQDYGDHDITLFVQRQDYDGWAGYPAVNPDEYQKFVDSAHAKGMKVLLYMESNHYDEMILSANDAIIHSPEDLECIVEMRKNCPLYRKILLAYANDAIQRYGIDGIYFDSMWSSATDTPGDNSGDDITVEGAIELVKDARMLLDSYDPNMLLIAHAWIQTGPHFSFSDFCWPGEQILGRNVSTLAMPEDQATVADAMYDIGYNPYLTGTQVIAINQDNMTTYNANSKIIHNQFVRNTFPSSGQETGSASWNQYWEKFRRYSQPLIDYGVNDCQIANTAHQSYSQTFAPTLLGAITKPTSLDVELYKKNDSVFVTITRSGDCETAGNGTITLRLDDIGFTSAQVDVTDAINGGTTRRALINGDLNLTVTDSNLPAEYVILPVP